MLSVIYKLDKERTLKLDFKAIERIEKKFDAEVDNWPTKFKISEIITLLTESMRNEWPDVTEDNLKDLISEYSNMKEAYKVFNACLESFFGKADPPAQTSTTQAVAENSAQGSTQVDGTGK